MYSDPFHILSYILTLTAVASYVNYRYIRLPQPIGMTLITVLLSLTIIVLSYLGIDLKTRTNAIIEHIDLSATLLNGMLSFLLFAGSLHINSLELAKYRQIIFTLATVGVIISTAVVGILLYWVVNWLHVPLPLVYCLLFGALISPTDPIAVLSILKNLNAPRSLEMKIAGEALFNDGMGIVMFLMVLGVATGTKTEITMSEALREFFQQAMGAVSLGAILGLLVAHYMSKVANFEVAALMTLALVTGGYTVAHALLHVSGPITMVVAGLIIGHKMRSGHMLENMINRLDSFWALLDEVLNSILFVLIGLEMLRFDLAAKDFLLTFITVFIVLFGRYVSVLLPVKAVKMFRRISPYVGVLTWGGMRGGVSIALALSMPDNAEKDIILSITYGVVLFSILVQGLTIGPLMRKTLRRQSSQGMAEG